MATPTEIHKPMRLFMTNERTRRAKVQLLHF
jgi:hypothetical protein